MFGRLRIELHSVTKKSRMIFVYFVGMIDEDSEDIWELRNVSWLIDASEMGWLHKLNDRSGNITKFEM